MKKRYGEGDVAKAITRGRPVFAGHDDQWGGAMVDAFGDISDRFRTGPAPSADMVEEAHRAFYFRAREKGWPDLEDKDIEGQLRIETDRFFDEVVKQARSGDWRY